MRFTTCVLAAAPVACGTTWAPIAVHAATPGITYEALAVTGRDAPGTGGLVFRDYVMAPVVSNDSVYSFSAGVEGEGTDAVDRGLFVAARDGVRYLGREGGPARDLPGLSYRSITSFEMNRSGVVTYGVLVEGPGVTAGNEMAFYHGLPDALRLVARGGQAAPGGTGAETWRPGHMVIDASGNAVVSGTVGGDDAVWAGPVDALTLVARQGGASPTPGVTYGYLPDVTEVAPSGTFLLSTNE